MREGEAEASPREGRVGRGDALELRGASPEVRVGLPGRGEVGAADLWLGGVKEEERLTSWEVEVEKKKKKKRRSSIGTRMLSLSFSLSSNPTHLFLRRLRRHLEHVRGLLPKHGGGGGEKRRRGTGRCVASASALARRVTSQEMKSEKIENSSQK